MKRVISLFDNEGRGHAKVKSPVIVTLLMSQEVKPRPICL